jgi:pimeloyl-ACP methyl ester carboxylesterase
VLAAGAIASLRLRNRYQHDLERARQRLAQYGSRLVQTACGPIEYVIVGEGIPVLEAHGIFGGFDQGLVVARQILGEGFRIIAPSRFGYLRTPLPAGASPVSQADAYACLLDQVEIDRVTVMAHSAGSPSATQFALRYPERVAALVLIVPAAPGPGPTAPPKRLMEALFQTDFILWSLSTFVPSTLPMGVPRRLELTPHDRIELAAVIETMLPATPRRDGFLFDMYVSTPTLHSGIPFTELSVPVLLVTAVDDPLVAPDNVRRLAAAIPNARLL